MCFKTLEDASKHLNALGRQKLRQKQTVLVIWSDSPQQFKLAAAYLFAYSIKESK